MNERGAFVLIEPDDAWERDTLYPPLRSAELVLERLSTSMLTYTTALVGAEVARPRPCTLFEVK